MTPETLELCDKACGALVRLAGLVLEDTNREVDRNDHVSLIRHFNKVRVTTEQVKEARKALDQIEERLSREQVPDAMRAAKVKTITVIDVGRVTVAQRYACSIIDKDGGYKWLRDNGHGGLISETVNSSTLAGFAKNLVEVEGKELPEQYFKTSLNPYTSITKV